VVDADDPAFGNPTKPIGPVYPRHVAKQLAAERGWTVAPDGPQYRRVVASPEPHDIVETQTIRRLVEDSIVVICTGGGGIPVAVDETKELRGVEAVVDKDLASSLLAQLLEAEFLLLLTDVPAIELDWGTPNARPIEQTTPAELRRYEFAPGSMGPKVEAVCRFVEATNQQAAIGGLEDAARIVRGEAGTMVGPD
jgi:carbamate kinase